MARLGAKVGGETGAQKPTTTTTLLVVAPVRSKRTGGVGARLLSQHHCEPGPGEEEMGRWLKALAKRYKKVLGKVRKEAKEMEYKRERDEGFVRSEEEGKRAAAEERRRRREEEEEQAETMRREADLAERRATLLASMKDEPSGGGVAVSASLGERRERRRFEEGQPACDAWSWADCVFGEPREDLVFRTVDGRREWTWKAVEGGKVEIGELGWAKMQGLRVEVVKEEKEGDEVE